MTEEEIEAAIEAIVELGAYFEAFLAERRRQPRDDLMSALAEAGENDDRLTDEEILSTAILLFSAGFETTTNLLGNGLLALLAHPDQLSDWRAHPEIAPTAVEELLRFDSPVQFNLRTALEPADLVGQPLDAATGSSCCRAPPTATPTSSTVPTSSTSVARPTRR